MPLEGFFEDDPLSSLTGSSTSSRQRLSKFGDDFVMPQSLNGLLEQPKMVATLVMLLIVGLWAHNHSGFTSSAPPGTSRRALLANGDELKWAEDTFGLFLKGAIPIMEESNDHARNFLNMLSQGACDTTWSDSFAEVGTFSFSLPGLQAQLSTRQQVRDAFCKGPGKNVKAVRVVWHFPDKERLAGAALLDVFSQAAPGAEVRKDRWAQYATLTKEGGTVHIKDYRLYAEAPSREPLFGFSGAEEVNAIVKANLGRLTGHSCDGFEAALPSRGYETWMVQSLPIGEGTSFKHEYQGWGARVDRPRERIVEKCRSDTTNDWANIDLQHGSVEGVFLGAQDREVIIFFHKEKRYKNTVDVTDDPEALLVKWTEKVGLEPAVKSLHFFNIEAEHLVQEWGWKYGWASRQHR